MTFDEVMQRFSGEWVDGRALINQHGYFWCIAEGTAENYVITDDGKRYVAEEEPKPKRGRKAAATVEFVDA